MTKKLRFIGFAALMSSGLAPLPSYGACACLLPDIAILINQHAAIDAAGHAAVTAELNLFLPQINDGVAKVLSATEQAMAHRYGMSDRLIHEMHKSSQEQAAAENDAAAARSVLAGVHPAACSNGQQAQKVGVSLNTSAAAARASREAAKADFNRISNPRSEVTQINSLPERQRVAEMTASEAGTMSTQQFQDALVYRKVISPTPPVSPDKLPDAAKSKPAARAYEHEYKKYAATADLYNKMYNRDLQLAVRSIEVNGNSSLKNIKRIWNDITSGLSIPSDLRASSGDSSSFPDHWGGLATVTEGGREYISERDFIRTQVMMRYANPQYQNDEEYGLATLNLEGLMKEFIKIQAVQNRMIYEIMNAEVHEKMVTGLKGAWAADQHYAPKLKAMQADAMR